MNKKEQLIWLKEFYHANRDRMQTQQAVIAVIKSNEVLENTIHDLYLALFNKAIGGCGNCLADAFTQLYAFSNKKIDEIMDCKFKLKAGVLLQGVPTLPMATTANLTDEIAIAYLRDNIARADDFEVLPDNLEELLNGEKKTAQNEENEPIKKTRKRK